MGFAQNEKLIQTLAPKGADDALATRVLPGRARGDADLADPHTRDSPRELLAVDRVSIPSRNRGADSMRGDDGGVDLVAAGLADIHTVIASQLVVSLDAGKPIRFRTGIHAGCFELFGTAQIRSIKDLRGRIVAVPVLGSSHYLYVASIAAHVGLDPQKDIRFVTPPVADSARMLTAGEIAIVAFPTRPWGPRSGAVGLAEVARR